MGLGASQTQGLSLPLRRWSLIAGKKAVRGYREWWGRMAWDARQGARDTAGQNTAELMRAKAMSRGSGRGSQEIMI